MSFHCVVLEVLWGLTKMGIKQHDIKLIYEKCPCSVIFFYIMEMKRSSFLGNIMGHFAKKTSRDINIVWSLLKALGFMIETFLFFIQVSNHSKRIHCYLQITSPRTFPLVVGNYFAETKLTFIVVYSLNWPGE